MSPKTENPSQLAWSPDNAPISTTSQSLTKKLDEVPVADPNQGALSVCNLDFRTTSWVTSTWLIIVGGAAFLDFAATVLPTFVAKDDAVEVIKTAVVHRNPFSLRTNKAAILIPSQDPWIVDALQWLDPWSPLICIIFAIICFADAFVQANWKREEKLRDLDRRKCLTAATDEKDSTKPSEQSEDEFKGSWGAYYQAVVIQLLLLPVGFYLLAWHPIRAMANPTDIFDDDNEVDIVFTDDRGSIQKEFTMTTNTNYCLGFAILQYCATVVARLTGLRLKAKLRSWGIRISRQMAKFAVRHPQLFRRRVQKFLRAVRWLKYLAPLIGTFNKLLGNTLDLIKKYRQTQAAKKVQSARQRLWRKLSPEELQVVAVTAIQSRYRAHRTRKAYKAVLLIKGQEESLAALKLQTVLRGKLAQARCRVLRKKNELEMLREQEMAMMKNSNSHMSVDNRRRMYELQDELNLDAKELLNRKLLLRPNTSFAVTWKILFVTCCVLEISQLALKPVLDKYKDKTTRKPLQVGKILEQKLVPTPIVQWKACAKWVDEIDPLYKHHPHSVKGGRGLIQIFDALLPKKKNSNKRPVRPWYCKRSLAQAQSIYATIIRFLLRETIVIVGIVCFLDVFVTFFTGELDPTTGCLVPKDFFTRWLLPGLVLQLLVNPQMMTTSKYVGKLIRNVFHIGPVRVWRWMEAFFFPAFRIFVIWIERRVWCPLVSKQNQEVVQH